MSCIVIAMPQFIYVKFHKRCTSLVRQYNIPRYFKDDLIGIIHPACETSAIRDLFMSEYHLCLVLKVRRCASSTILQSTCELVSLYIESTRPLQSYDTCMQGSWSGICFIMLSQSQIEAVRKNQCHSRSGSSLIIIVIWGQISFARNSQSLLCIDLNALRNPAQMRQGRCLTTSSGACLHWTAWAARMRWIMRVMKVRD